MYFIANHKFNKMEIIYCLLVFACRKVFGSKFFLLFYICAATAFIVWNITLLWIYYCLKEYIYTFIWSIYTLKRVSLFELIQFPHPEFSKRSEVVKFVKNNKKLCWHTESMKIALEMNQPIKKANIFKNFLAICSQQIDIPVEHNFLHLNEAFE